MSRRPRLVERVTEAITIVQRSVHIPDPHDCTDNADARALLESVFDALVRRGPDGRFRPAVAEHWSCSADAKSWDFHLRPELRFHDGSPLDASAVRFSLERMKRPDVGATLGAPAVWGQYLGDAEIVDLGPRTVRITTGEPLADLLDVLVDAYVLPPARADRQDFRQHPVGSGAYQIEDMSPGEWVRMSANPHWYAGPPANAKLIWRTMSHGDDRLRAVIDGTAQVATKLDLATVEWPAQAALHTASDLTRVDHLDPTAIIFVLNATRGPFRDPHLRRAVNLAIDRDALIQTVLQGSGRPLTGFVSPAHAGYQPPVAHGPRVYDPDAARSLMAKAGVASGLDIVADCPTRLPDEAVALGDAVALQLQSMGIRLSLKVTEDRTRYAEQVRDKQIHDLCLFDSSPLSTFRVLNEKVDSRVRGSWWQGYKNAEVEALLDRSRRCVDSAQRRAMFESVYALLVRDPPWLTLYNHVRSVLLRGTWNGWQLRSDGVLDAVTLPALR